MADESNEPAEGVEYTKSNAQLDMEARLAEDFTPDSNISTRTTVNPNPFGQEDYAGTDPIYQNYASDTHKPLAADEGPDQLAEDFVRDLYEPGDKDLVNDFGLGGEATPALSPNVEQEQYLVPGQEGYPENPEKYTGPPIRRSLVEGATETKTESESAEGPDVQPPASPAAPSVSHGIEVPQQPSTNQ